MRILIGYSMRSGSTLLQHILDQHPDVQSYSDLSSLAILPRLLCGFRGPRTICVKPLDVFYLFNPAPLLQCFDKFVWLARDPRDAYLSTVESRYGYLMWLPGKKNRGVDMGLLNRWKRIYRQYFNTADRWHMVKYEELATDPDKVIEGLLTYLELPAAKLLPFKRFQWMKGGDMKLRHTHTVQPGSVGRHRLDLTPEQGEVFQAHLGDEMRCLGYL